MPQGYDGLPPSYIGLGNPLTPNLGLSLAGMDPLVAENFWLIDVFAGGGGGTSVFVNSVSVTNPNFNDTTPVAAPGFLNVTWHVSGSDVSASIDTSSIVAHPAGNTGDIQFNNAGVFDATDNFTWDVNGDFGLAIVTTTNGGFFDVANNGANVQMLAIGTEMDISGTVTSTATNVDIFTGVALGTTINNVKGMRIAASVNSGVGTSVGQYIGLDIVGPATSNVTLALGLRISNFSFASNTTDSRSLQVLDGNIEFSSGTALLTGNSFVDPTDQTRGFLIDFGQITSGNIWNVHIPDADSATATNATVVANQALSGFDITSGQFSFVPIAHTNAGGAGLALASYNAVTGLFTTIAVGTGTVTSFSAGNLSPLFTTSVATATTTPALTFALSNAGGGTVFGNNTTSAAAPAYTTAPVLGIPGTSTGTLALASSTASGKFTLTAPASSATPTLTLPTTSNVLAGQFAGDNVIFTSTLQVASAAGTLTPSLLTQTANTVLAGPTSGGVATPTFRALVVADIPNSTITPIWNNLQNATGALTLANAGNATTFNQTSAVTWTWANTTAATSSVSQSSPIHSFNGTYWTGAASATDSWTIQDVVANGTNGTSQLTIAHSGSTGIPSVIFPLGSAGTANGYSIGFTGGSAGFAGQANGVAAIGGTGSGWAFNFYGGATLIGSIVTDTTNVGFKFGSAGTTGSVWIGDFSNGSRTTVNAVTAFGTQQANQWKPTAGGPAYGVSVGGGHGPGGQGHLGFSPASGAVKGIAFAVEPTVNQTSTATGDFTVIHANLTNTAFLGTNLLLMDLQLGAASQFTMNSVGVVTKYAATTTVGQGIPSQIGTVVDSTAQSAAITATNIIASAPRTGMYRISWSATITTAATTSSVLGGTNGFQVGFTSPTDSVAKTVVPGNSTTSAGNTTGTAVAGSYVVYAKTGTAITYAFDYTSVGGTAMVYELHVRLEAM